MKKLMILMISGALILLAVAIGVSAMPDEGNASGRVIEADWLIQSARNVEPSQDCVVDQNTPRLTREEWKELRTELALYDADNTATVAMAACILRNNVATK